MISDEILQVAKYTEYLEVLFGPEYDVIPGLVLTRATDLYQYETFGRADAVIPVCAGDAKINNARYKGYFHKKAKMLTREEVNALIGHDVGGVCPFGIKVGVDVYLDESLKWFEKIYPACGSANSAVELTPEELEKLSNCKEWIDVCKIPDEE